MSRSKNFSLTMNNPVMPLNEFADLINHEALYARTQSEKGENGTLHYQACVGYSKLMNLTTIIKRFKGCHCEVTRNAQAAWDYCGKEDTRQEGPYSHGIPPASKAVKGDTKKRNGQILEYGLAKAIDEGLVPLDRAAHVQKGINLYHG